MSNLSSALARVREPLNLLPGDQILVLFDPDGSVCSEIRSQGFNPVCVPDRQSGIRPTVTHETINAELVSELLRSDRLFKLAVATNGHAHFFDVTNPHEQANLVQWLKRNVEISLVNAPRTEPWLLANQLGPYRLYNDFNDFEYMAEIDSSDSIPLVALSDHHLWDGHNWYASRDLTAIRRKWLVTASGLTENGGVIPGVQTFKSTDNKLIKYEIISPDYFDRSQVIGEANFLEIVPSQIAEELQLPTLHGRINGRAVVTLTREYIAGSEMVEHSPALPSEIVLALMTLGSNFAKHGYFHNDIRPWNVIWSAGKPTFIDFADASRQDLDVQGIPNIAALFGTILYFSGLAPKGFALDDSPTFADQLARILAELGVTDLNDEHGALTYAWLELPLRYSQLTDFMTSSFTHLDLWNFLCEGPND